MSITYLLTGGSFMTVAPGPDEADVSVPAVANSLSDALQQVHASYQFEDIKVERIDTLPMSRGKTMLAVYTEQGDRSGDPLMLVYHGDIGFSQKDVDAMSKPVLEQFIRDNPVHLSGDDLTSNEAEMRATAKLMMDRMFEDQPS